MKLPNINRRPNKWKRLAIFFSIMTVGMTAETASILTSPAEEIVNKTGVSIMAIIFSGIFLLLTIWFWRKSANTKRM